MKKDSFLSAMGDVDERFIAEYEKAKKARRTKLVTRAAAIAASVCLVITTAALSLPLLIKDKNISKAEEPLPILQATEPAASDTTAPDEPDEPDEPTGPITVLSVTPEKMNGDYVACDSDFIVEAENATADLVREHLFISGGPEYTVTEESEGKYRVSLKGSLSSGNVVSLSYANDGVTEYSWAFETERRLSVVASYPAQMAARVDTTAFIELELSMTTDAPLSDRVTFTPSVEGTWEQFGRIHRFVPSSPLAEDTDYTLTLKSGATAKDVTMTEDYVLSFRTGERYAEVYTNSPFMSDIYNYTTEEEPLVRYSGASEGVTPQAVEISTFASGGDMLAYAAGDMSVLTHSTESVSFTLTEQKYGKWDLTLTPLPKGCYLATVYGTENNVICRAVIQINDISAYAAVTGDDVLVWTEDAGVTASLGKAEAVTDGNGIAILKDAAKDPDNGTVVTLKRGEDVQLIKVPDLASASPNGYIYCDKPVYHPTDTVHIFGAVPLQLFDGEGQRTFTAELHLNGSKVAGVPVTPNEDGAFSAELPLVNITEHSFAELVLLSGGTELASRYVNVEDYYLDNYVFDVIPSEDEVITEGEDFTFGVKVTHISGVTVQGKELRASVNGEFIYAVTDADGIATFTVPYVRNAFGPVYQKNTQYYQLSVGIYNNDITDVTSYDYITSVSCTMLNTPYAFTTDCTSDSLSVKSIYINGEGDASCSTSYIEQNGDITSAGEAYTAHVTVELTHKTRKKTGVKADENTGKTCGVYDGWEETVETVMDWSREKPSADDVILDLSGITLPEADELNCYHLYLYYTLTYENGIEEQHSYLLGGNNYVDPYDEPEDGYGDGTGTVDFTSVDNSPAYMDDEYHTYRYTFSATLPEDGDEVEVTVTDALSGEELTEGTFLRVIFRNGIIKSDIVSAEELDFTLDEELYPFFKMTLALYRDGRFYRMPERSVTRDHESQTLNIEIVNDKENYSPSEEATVTLRLTDSKGEPVKGTVNLSVVNEALLKNAYHETNMLSTIYRTLRKYRLFTHSSYFDRELNGFMGGYGDGGGGDTRVDFDDTACFETVRTDENGEATVTFRLPDSITEYRITVHAADGRMRYGVNTGSITVSMDFFLQSTPKQGLKCTDDFVPSVNSVSTVGYGTVNYTFTVKETGKSMDAYAFTGRGAQVNFGKLPAGTYTLRIDATLHVDDTGKVYTDAIEYPFTVVESAMYSSYTDTAETGVPLTFAPTSYPARIELFTEERAYYLSLFDFMDGLPRTRADYTVSRACTDKLYNGLTSDDRMLSTPLPAKFCDKNNLPTMYGEGSADYILTALTQYYLPSAMRYPTMPISADNHGYILSLMVRAAKGEAALADLKAAESYAENDLLLSAIAASYAMLGDYENAYRVYSALPERSDERGADALRCFTATFVDRGSARALLSTLISEEPEEYYLGFAVTAFITNRVLYSDEVRTVSLTLDGLTEEYEVSGIDAVTVAVTEDGTGSHTFTVNGEGIGACVTYIDSERRQSTDDFHVSLTGETKSGGVAYLTFDLSGFTGTLELQAALPPSLCLMSKGVLPQGVTATVNNEHLKLTVTEKAASTLSIPLLINSSGNYQLEPLRLTTEGGNHYYSNEIVFDIE